MCTGRCLHLSALILELNPILRVLRTIKEMQALNSVLVISFQRKKFISTGIIAIEHINNKIALEISALDYTLKGDPGEIVFFDLGIVSCNFCINQESQDCTDLENSLANNIGRKNANCSHSNCLYRVYIS